MGDNINSQQILPLLMESLQTDGREDDNELQVSTLDSLCTIMHDTPAVMGPHVPALVPRLLELAQASPHMVSSNDSLLVIINTHYCSW